MEYDGNYSDFIKLLSLKRIYLKALDVSRTTKLDIDEAKLHFELERITFFQDLGEKQIRYEVKAKITGYEDEENKKELFHLDFITEAVYGLSIEIAVPEEYLKKYERNAIFNVWPYLRNTISDISRRMELDLPPIPLFKISAED